MDLREIAELLASADVPQNKGSSPAANRVSQAMMDNAFRLASPAPNMLASMNNPAPQQNVISTADIAKQLSDTVVDRGTFVPLVEYANGGFGLGLPGVLHAPIDAAKRMLTPGYDYDNVAQASRDALDASGLAFTGGLAANAAGLVPRGAVGSAGGRLARGSFELEYFGKPVKILQNPTPMQQKGFLNRTKYKAARMIKDPETGDVYIWDAADPALHELVAEKLGVKYDAAGDLSGQMLMID